MKCYNHLQSYRLEVRKDNLYIIQSPREMIDFHVHARHAIFMPVTGFYRIKTHDIARLNSLFKSNTTSDLKRAISTKPDYLLLIDSIHIELDLTTTP